MGAQNLMINSDQIFGKTVVGAAGNYIGEVNNIEIDASTWHVVNLVIKLSDKATKEFGLKKTLKSPTIKIPTSLIKNIGVIIKLDLSLEDLNNYLR